MPRCAYILKMCIKNGAMRSTKSDKSLIRLENMCTTMHWKEWFNELTIFFKGKGL